MLEQNYPNPFNPATVIRYQIPDAGYVKLIVYDVLGKEVDRLVDEYQQQGTYQATFYSYDVASGIYFYALQYNGAVEARRMVVLK